MRDEKQLSGLVADLYETAAGENWDGVSERLAEYMGRSHIIIGGYGVDVGMTRRGLAGFTNAHFAEFQTRYAAGAAVYANRLMGKPGRLAEHHSETPPIHPGYEALADHVRDSFGLAPEYGAILDPSLEHIELIVVAHEIGRLGEEPAMREHFAALVPHLRRAHRLSQAAARRALRLGALEAAFDRVSAGLFLCEADSRILHMNFAARSLVAEAVGLAVRGGCLRAHDAAADRLLTSEIAAAAQRRAGARSTLIAAPRRFNMPLLLTVAAHAPGAAIIIAEDPERDMAPDLERLMRGSGLSRAQAWVSLLAAAGRQNSEIARQLGVSENTVKTHLARVFHKLDCQNRRALALRLAAIRGVQN